jgi:hypothetical protein
MQASLPHLYWHFLIFQSHLDGAAAQSEKEGKDGTWLRDHLQRQLNFSDAQFDCVRTSAQHLASQLSDLDAQVKAIIAADYARNPPSPANPKWSRPIAPEIKELTRQREALIQAEVSRLQTALGPQAAGQLDDYLHNTFARNVTVQKFPPHPDPEAVRQQLQNLQRKAAQK